MGDGHHGWAAAEIVLAVRDAFIFEREGNDSPEPDIVLLAGIPKYWFNDGNSFSIKNAPIPGAKTTLAIMNSSGQTSIDIQFEPVDLDSSAACFVRLPFCTSNVYCDSIVLTDVAVEHGETIIKIGHHSQRLTIHHGGNH